MRGISKTLRSMETHCRGEGGQGIPGAKGTRKVLFLMSCIHTHSFLFSVCRIAANEPLFLSFHLKVQDQRDKQKLTIKALDVVLFGPPTRNPESCFFFNFDFSSSFYLYANVPD